MPPEDNPADDVPADKEEYERWAMGAAADRLRRLLESPPLTASVSGGGIPDPCSIVQDRALLIDRGEVENLLRLLGALPPVGGAVEGKYGVISTTGKQLHPGEPVFLFRATDPFAPTAIRDYAFFCVTNGCNPEHVAACRKHARRIEEWQKANPALVKKLPG